ncbi:MAG: winged helix-turn-helix domain-containing protein [Pseudomonadota bacterium]
MSDFSTEREHRRFGAASAGASDSVQSLKNGFCVGEWDVQPLRGRIVHGDTRQHLEPRIMEVLICLASRAGEVVERDELLHRVWGERAVTDEPLTRCIAELRRALGDTRKNPKFIQTIPKRGYRLVAPVSAPTTSANAAPATPTSSVGHLVWIVALGALALGLYVWLASLNQPPLPIEAVPNVSNVGPPSVAVLPLKNRSNDADMDYFSVGVTEDIINLLATIPDLAVTSRTSSFYFQDKDLDLPAIAEQLNVQAILEGSVRRQGDEVRVTVQLIDVATDTPLDALRISRPLGDIFEVQDEIAETVANRLRVSLGRIPDRVRPTENMQAHQLYLQARFENRKRTAESMNKAIALLDQAIVIDPEFAAAYAELAHVYIALPGYSQRPSDRIEVVLPKALAAAKRANELDPMLSKPYAILAWPPMAQTNYVAARQGGDKALALGPNDPEVRIWYGMMLSAVGDLDEALAQFAWAQRVDPLSGMTNAWLAFGLRNLGRDDEAASYFETSMALGYVNALLHRAQLHIDYAEFDEAHELLNVWTRGQGIDPDWARVYLAAVKNPARRDEAIAWIRELEVTHRDFGPATYAAVGALDEAFESADAALQVGATLFFFDIANREYREFRRDPRFAGLVRKTGLIDYWNTHGWNGYCQMNGDDLRCE